ncbi:MAG: hypothetical protein IH872_09280 [Chloroflexi bacterium]|nr:hypothetical protein [Chloroflexota bacterium]
MNNELETLLLEYLADQKSLEGLRDWVALNIWDSPADDAESAIDVLALELAHLDDGSTDLQYFRAAINELLGNYTVVVDQGDGTGTTTSTSMNTVHTTEFTDPLIPPHPIRVGPVVLA